MKYIFLTYDGVGLPVAHKLLKEGNDVIIGQINKLDFMKGEEELEKRRLSLYEGMIEKIDAKELIEKMRKENTDDWFVISDFNYVYPYAEKLKKMGFKGLLPTANDFEFEKDRNMAKEYVMRRYDIFSYQDIQEFSNIKEALNFLKNSKKIYGIKGYHSEAPTYFPMSNDRQIAYCEVEDVMINNQKLYESEGFILEEKIEDLTEFVPEIVVNNSEIVGMNIDIEYKHIGGGNTGFLTGDSASFIFWIDKNEPAFKKLYELFFKPSMDKWAREDEMVVWDAGVMYSPSRDKFYFSEYCSNREGYSSLFNKLSTFKNVSEYYERIVNNQYLFDSSVKPFGNSIRVFNEIRDKNFKHLYAKNVLVLTDKDNKNIWLLDVFTRDGKLYTAGYDYNLAVLTYAGDDWKDNFCVIDKVLSNGKTFVFPEMIYRRSFDLIRNDYPQNFDDRFKFVYNFIGRKKINKEAEKYPEMEELEKLIKKIEEI